MTKRIVTASSGLNYIVEDVTSGWSISDSNGFIGIMNATHGITPETALAEFVGIQAKSDEVTLTSVMTYCQNSLNGLDVKIAVLEAEKKHLAGIHLMAMNRFHELNGE